MLSKDIWMNLRLKSVLAFLLLMLSSYSNAILDSISVSDVLVTEGSIARALVTISPAAGENGQIILYEASAETAAGDDYFLASNRMVIEAGNTTGVIEVVIPVNDDAGVDLETFKLGVRADHILNSGFENGSAAFQVKEGVYNTVFRREINNPDPTYCVLGADVWVIKDWVCSYPYTFETNTVSAYGHVGTNSVHEIDAESQGFQNLVVTPGVEYEISLKATRRLHVDTPSTVDTTIEVVTQADFEVIAATTFTRSNTVWNLTEEKIIIPASNTEANIRLQFSTTNSTTTGMIIDDLSVVRVNPLGEGALASADAVATIGIIDASATAPQVLINSPHTTSAESFDVNFLFSEEINGFDLSDIQVSNGSVSNLISPELNLYQATVMPNPSPLESSEIVFTLLAGAVTSVSGGEENVTTSVTTIYDVIKPTVTVTPTEFNTLEANTITLNFSKPVAVLTLAGISVDNAVLSTFTKIDNSTYSVLLDPADSLIEAEQVTLLLGADAVSDAAGNMNDEVSIGIIFDQTPPVISVNGDSVVYSILGEQYNDAGASVIDLFDADIANKLVTVNSVDINAIADYSVTYDVTDAAGNVAVQKVRAVRVVVDPLITIKNYAADQSNSAPIISDFELIGIVGVSNENLLNINQKIASLTAIQVDSEDKIQVIVDQVIADLRSAAAIDVIKAFAESNINPAPTVTDYTTAEITGVTVSNIGAVNNAIDAITAAQADTANKIQAIVNQIVADLATAAAIDMIEAFADSNTNPVPAEGHYSAAGVAGVTSANIDAVNAAVEASSGVFADTTAKIQAIVSSVINSLKALAELIEDLNGNANSRLITANQLDEIHRVEGVIIANIDEYNAAFISAAFSDVNNPIAAEINAVIASVNTIVANETAALNELKEDIAGNANNDLVEASELNAIRGVNDAIQANQVEYQAAFIATSPSPFADTANPTPAEIQAVIDSVNTIVADENTAISELVEDLNGNANTNLITATQLEDIRGVTGVITVNLDEYSAAFVPAAFNDINNPTVAEINAVIASVNTIVANETAALNELKEDIAGNANNDLVEASELNAIRGVSGAIQANQAEYQAAFIATSPSPFADPANPTPAEIQAVIDSVNTIVANETAALNELKEDIAGNTNNDLVEASELNAIRGVSDAIQANQSEYQAAFTETSPSPFADSTNPTASEIQTVIDSVNTIVANETAALNELKEDIAGNANNDLVEASELNAIRGVSGAIQDNQAEYQAAFIATSPSPFADPANPTPAEIQAVIDSVNTIVADEKSAIDELKEDIAGNTNNDLIEASELNAIRGVTNAIQANQAEYQTAFIETSPSPFADTNNPTPAEIQAVINSVNTIVADETAALDQLKEDIAGNGNGDLIDADELNVIRDVSGAIQENQAEYQAAFTATSPSPFADPANPAPSEIQAVIDSVNIIVADETAALDQLKEDIAGNSNGDLIDADELNAIRDVSGAVQENQAEYQAAFTETSPSPFADTANPTASEIQAVIDSVNTIVANETAALDQLKEDIAGNSNGDLIDADELNAIRDVSGAVQENQAGYQDAFSASTPSPFADPTNPTAAEIQAIITAVNNGDVDSDNDGLPDSVDANDDNDDLTDEEEAGSTPTTSTTDSCDPDTRHDNCDFDKDGVINGSDDDDDNDGVKDLDEVTEEDRSNVDSDGNGICDGAMAFAAVDSFKGCMPNTNPDSDADYDNDGTKDNAELSGDTDGDLIPDYLDADGDGSAPSYGDSDKDGIDDKTECGPVLPCRDTDKDGVYDYLDTDSDNDGISDDEEADGVSGNGQDVTATDGSVKAKDTDTDGIPDYLDTDSDNDGKTDADENSPVGKDTDSDGIPDVVDHDDNNTQTGGGDSDNDGLSDAEECPNYPTNCPDSDNDGQPDYLDNNNDSDFDGIPDGDEDSNLDNDNNPATNPRDTDGDGVYDYLDTDSDNDGIDDADERSTPYDSNNLKDTDSDGIPDVIDSTNGDGDADSDGIPDSLECTGQPCRDTDNDGIPDFMDEDSDNDGLLDADEIGDINDLLKDTDDDGIPDVVDPSTGEVGQQGGDSDNDGVADAVECNSWPNCADSDNDGIDDYLDEDSSPEISTPDSAPESAPVVEQDLGTIKTGVHGAGNVHWGFALMLSLLVVLRRKSTVLMALPMLVASLGANAEWWDEMDLYVGAGVGQSYLDPGLGGTAYEIDDHTKNAWKLTAGWDWNDHISIEGYYTELGTVDLKPGAHMTYRMMGGDAMLHFWAHGEERKKGSIALYAKAGLNHMTNNANGVNYDQGSNFQLFGGLGAELYLQRRFSVRLELESYDTDAALLSLNLIKRFGFKSKTRLKSEVLPKVEPQILDIVPVVVDSDLDGFLDDEDQCPYTPEGLTVDDRGCAEFDGKLGDLIASIQFEVNSASLTETSKISLSEIVNMLKVYPAVKVDVQAHSDNTGSARYNKTLSQKRAESVVDYLRQKNITGSRLTAEGFGEERPVAENTTKDGRAKNRRVEFVLTRR